MVSVFFGFFYVAPLIRRGVSSQFFADGEVLVSASYPEKKIISAIEINNLCA